MNLKILNGKIKSNIIICKDAILSGDVVAFPTETVYGLGANAFNKNAINKIFILKNRPQDNPLILHIYKKEQLDNIAHKLNDLEEKLINKFWPGPLTIILKKKNIPDEVSRGLSTVAVRMPNNKVALNFLKFTDVPIAAPSANLSGKPSSTNAKHVYNDFKNTDLKYILDGNKTVIGIESTVIKVIRKKIVILRPGFITKEDIQKQFPSVKIENVKNSIKVESPGVKYKHYKPNAKVFLKTKDELIKLNSKNNNNIYFITHSIKLKNYQNNFYYKKLENLSKNLYNIYRQADERNVKTIYIELIKEEKLGFSIMNRIKKSVYSKS